MNGMTLTYFDIKGQTPSIFLDDNSKPSWDDLLFSITQNDIEEQNDDKEIEE